MSKIISIREQIQALIQAELAASIAAMLGNVDTERVERPTVRAAELVKDDEQGGASKAERTPTRRRRRSAPRTAYVITDRETLNGADLPAGNTVEVAKAFMTLGKRGAGVTEATVVKATGLKTKAVQSSIWWLRNHDASGRRLDMTNAREAKRALIRSTALDGE